MRALFFSGHHNWLARTPVFIETNGNALAKLPAMDDNDAFFTHTVVGAPFSVVLGRRMNPQQAATAGIEVDLADGRVRLGQPWTDAWFLGRSGNNRGQPRRRPGATLLWLERHALFLAGAGLAALAAAGALLTFGLRPWL